MQICFIPQPDRRTRTIIIPREPKLALLDVNGHQGKSSTRPRQCRKTYSELCPSQKLPLFRDFERRNSLTARLQASTILLLFRDVAVEESCRKLWWDISVLIVTV